MRIIKKMIANTNQNLKRKKRAIAAIRIKMAQTIKSPAPMIKKTNHLLKINIQALQERKIIISIGENKKIS